MASGSLPENTLICTVPFGAICSASAPFKSSLLKVELVLLSVNLLAAGLGHEVDEVGLSCTN